MAYKPIDSYGMIGDLQTIALIGQDASVDFMCFPDYDSPTIFGALLDADDGGRFSIEPIGGTWRDKQLYLPDSNVLVTQFLSESGIAEITDFMPIDEAHLGPRLVRRLTAQKGTMKFELRCHPRFDYARRAHTVGLDDGWFVFTPEGDDLPAVRLKSSIPLEIDNGAATAVFSLEPDQVADFVFEVVSPVSKSDVAEPGYVDAALLGTVRFWRDWVGRGRYPSRWREMVVRSALTMKMLCSNRTGGVAAAATFGLPEQIGGERNWDYRFTWIRDASLTTSSLASLGFTEELSQYIGWVEDRFAAGAGDGSLQIMYGIDGRHDLAEESLCHLEGYMKSAPVRIGNGAYDQLQLDIYGELMTAVDTYDDLCEPISHDLWQNVASAVNWVCNNWRRTDEGVWEVRGGQREFLFSRFMSWVAVDRGLKIARRRSRPAPIENWVRVRDDIYREIFDHYWNDDLQAFVQYKDGATLDASCMLMPIHGFISPTDPRWLSTLDAIARELVDGSFVYRYRTADAASDGLDGEEGTFTMCSFWYAENLARAGRVEEARLFFEKLNGFANHLGLYSEELSPGGVSLGNYPQAFTHLGLIRAARHLDEALTGAGVGH